MSFPKGISVAMPYLPIVKAIPPKAPIGANSITQCNPLKIYLDAIPSGFIILSRPSYLLKKIPNRIENNNTWIVRLSFKNFSKLKDSALVVYFDISPPDTDWVLTPLPG